MIIYRADDSLLLFSCEDPRGSNYENTDNFIPRGNLLKRDSSDLLPSGVYMLFKKLEDSDHTIPLFLPNLILSQTRTRTQTATPSGNHTPGTPKSADNWRNYLTCQAVRRRDVRCCVTGQEAVKRPRGANFPSLEVAHIWPLAFAGSEALTNVNDGAKALLKDCNAADQPDNAFLLRNNILLNHR